MGDCQSAPHTSTITFHSSLKIWIPTLNDKTQDCQQHGRQYTVQVTTPTCSNNTLIFFFTTADNIITSPPPPPVVCLSQAMAKKVTELRIQRSVLRRVVQDKLQALLRGDFYVRNHLGEENYDPIVAEVKKLNEGILLALMQHEKEQRSQQMGGGGGTTAAAAASTTAAPTAQLQFSKELESFIQILAASIMIDASMRGENAGESDTRFIKKKKKLLTRMLMGGKLYILRREIVRFDLMNKRWAEAGVLQQQPPPPQPPPQPHNSNSQRNSNPSSKYSPLPL